MLGGDLDARLKTVFDSLRIPTNLKDFEIVIIPSGWDAKNYLRKSAAATLICMVGIVVLRSVQNLKENMPKRKSDKNTDTEVANRILVRRRNRSEGAELAKKDPSRSEFLEGWKQIAGFVGYSVAVTRKLARTGLPVTRKGRTVVAAREGLKQWELHEWEKTTNRVWSDPRFSKIKHGIWQRWRTLHWDKQFIEETARLKLHLSLSFKNSPADIRAFFNPIFIPNIKDTQRIARRIKKISDPQLRTVLKRYVKYVFRFGVAMQLYEKKPPFFRTAMVAVTNTKFSVKVVDNQILPIAPFFWDGHTPVQDFYAEEIEVGSKMQNFIDEGHGRYVQIEDNGKNSVLQQLVEFAYSPTELTFVLLSARQPFMLCLIGELVQADATWKTAAGVVGELQKTHYGRINAGRPLSKSARRDLAILLRVKGGRTFQAATSLARENKPRAGDRLNSRTSSMSQLMRKLKI